MDYCKQPFFSKPLGKFLIFNKVFPSCGALRKDVIISRVAIRFLELTGADFSDKMKAAKSQR